MMLKICFEEQKTAKTSLSSSENVFLHIFFNFLLELLDAQANNKDPNRCSSSTPLGSIRRENFLFRSRNNTRKGLPRRRRRWNHGNYASLCDDEQTAARGNFIKSLRGSRRNFWPSVRRTQPEGNRRKRIAGADGINQLDCGDGELFHVAPLILTIFRSAEEVEDQPKRSWTRHNPRVLLMIYVRTRKN